MKRCSRCRQDLPLDSFNKDRQRSDGLAIRCRECAATYVREWKAANKDRVRASNQRWNQNNAAYYRERKRAWRAENPELERDAAQKWRAANPDKARQKDLRRRAAKAGTTTGDVDLIALWESNRGCCQLCGQPIDSELRFPHPLSRSVDHIVPLSKGGRHEQANLQWTHLVENIRKGATVPIANRHPLKEAIA